MEKTFDWVDKDLWPLNQACPDTPRKDILRLSTALYLVNAYLFAAKVLLNNLAAKDV